MNGEIAKALCKLCKNSIILLFTGILALLFCTEDPITPETTGRLEGFVKDATTKEAIVDVTITTNPATQTVLTDSSGYFQLEDVAEGEYSVKAQKQGYVLMSVAVEVPAGETASTEILLSEKEDGNHTPLAPSQPNPSHQAAEQELSLTLHWQASDPDEEDGDSLLYDLWFSFKNSPMQILAQDHPADSFNVEGLDYSTIYHWQVVARDTKGTQTYGPVWSFSTKAFPNNRIVFASNRDGDFNVYSAAEDGTYITRLTDQSYIEWYPRWHPERHLVAFSSNKDIEPHIYLMNPDGSETQKITSLPIAGYHNYGSGFAWSPTGHKLIYPFYEKLFQMDWDGDNRTQIATAPAHTHFQSCDWAPYGDKIAAIVVGEKPYDTDLYLIDANNGEKTLLYGDTKGKMGHPSFSPDGQSIAFYHDVSGLETVTGQMLNSHIKIITIDGSDTTDVSDKKGTGRNDFDPSWSPDGSKIIFTHQRNDYSEPPEIWIMDISGENREKLIDHAQMADWQ